MSPRTEKSWSLARRIAARTAMGVAGTGVVLSLLAAVVAVRGAQRELAVRARTTAAVLAGAAADPLERLDVAALRKLLGDARRERDVVDALVFDATGRVLTDGTLANPRRHHPAGPPVRLLAAPREAWIQRARGRVTAVEPVRVGNRRIGGVACTLSTADSGRAALRLGGSLLVAGLVFAGLVTLAAWRGAVAAFRPLDDLRSAMDATVAGENPAEIPVDGPREIRAVARAFATLLARLRVTTISRDLLSSVLDGVGEGLLVLREDGVVEEANPVVARMTGRSAPELEGIPAPELLRLDGGEDLAPVLSEACARPEVAVHRRGELDTVDVGHRSVPVLLTFRAAQRVGGGMMVVCLVRDITELDRLETMKERFLAAVSHELRTPLTSIRGALALLAEGRAGALPEPAQRMAAIGLANSERLGALIDDLLDLQQAAEGRLGLELSEVDAAAAAARAVDAARGAADAAGIGLELVADGEATARADARRLEQVVGNLVSNAIKHAPPGSAVEVTVRAAGDMVRIEVADRGRGVPAAFVPHLFQRFTQAEDADGRKVQGSGLGLALVKELVEGMGGRAGYTPRTGGGAEFWIELPGRPGGSPNP